LRALPQLRNLGRVPAQPGDADGPGRDRADSRRTQPRRSGAGRHVRLMKRVAIAGGGASGALLAVNLLRHTGAEVVLIERGPRVARGAAYGTDDPNHLLNVRADRMSALPDEPGHFADWLEAHGGCREDFAERRAYGAYLGELLADASVPGRFRVVRGEVTDIRSEGGREVLDVDAERIEADVAVLALGNLEPSTPA